tara:strand:+ start:24061 stop:25104 length:1044 start_codon:yes stop_codon:yes gene_type:complete
MAALDYSNFGRPGQVNNTGATDAMFLELFSGEVLASFERATVMQGKVRERTISGQKSASFPLIGRASTTGYHAAGTEIEPTSIAHNEQVISIDGLMYASTFVDDFEDMLNHYEVRSAYAKELGATLGFTYDQHLLRKLILTAREANALYAADNTQLPAAGGDNQIEDDTFQLTAGDTLTGDASSVAAKAEALANAIFAAQEKFDNAFVSETDEKICILRPKDYYDLLAGTQESGFSVINRDYDGAGSYADGKVLKIGGVTILKTPNLPSTNVAQSGAATGIDYYHYGDFSKTVGVIFSADAIGVVRLLGLGVQTDYQVERQGTLMVARQSVGIGTLRPECAVELKIA